MAKYSLQTLQLNIQLEKPNFFDILAGKSSFRSKIQNDYYISFNLFY